MTKITKEIPEFSNRHLEPLPKRYCKMVVLVKNATGQHVYLCNWHPYNPAFYAHLPAGERPGPGFIGTAITLGSRPVSFSAWRQANKDFVYYSIR